MKSKNEININSVLGALAIVLAFIGTIYVHYMVDLSKTLKYVLGLTYFGYAYCLWKFGWWKAAAPILLLYTVIAGFLLKVPHVMGLQETIRNLFFHVPLWMVMVTLLLASMVNAILYLKDGKLKNDNLAFQTAKVGVLFGFLGISTGSIWAKATWGEFWHNDPKQLAAAIAILVYLAYFVLRSSIDDDQKRARISNVYNIFCFPTFLMLIFIIPRLVPGSSHPVKPMVNSLMRVVYYPADVAWLLLGVWLVHILVRKHNLKMKYEELD